MDWLNNITDESINFFGIEIEAYKIGESLPAPNFNIVSKPNNWTKSVKVSATSGKITDTRQFQLEYWIAFKKHLEETGSFLKGAKPYPQHWHNFSLGKSSFYLPAICSVRDSFVRAQFEIYESGSKNRFEKLRSLYESDSKSQFGEELIWNELPNAKYSTISIRKDTDVKNRNLWSDQHEWLREMLEKMDKYFRSKIKEL